MKDKIILLILLVGPLLSFALGDESGAMYLIFFPFYLVYVINKKK